MPKKTAKPDPTQELINDLQRLRADFENYRKRVDAEKASAADYAAAATIHKLLPIFDIIDRAVAHVPAELADNPWAQGVMGLQKSLASALKDLGLTKIAAGSGTLFDPDLHEAVMFDEAKGDTEVIAEELRPGYMLNGQVLRPSMVKVTRK